MKQQIIYKKFIFRIKSYFFDRFFKKILVKHFNQNWDDNFNLANRLKYQKQLEKIKSELNNFDQLLLKTAYHWKPCEINLLPIANWKDPLYLNQIVNFEGEKTINLIKGEKNSNLEIIRKVFNLNDINIEIKNDKEKQFFLVSSNSYSNKNKLEKQKQQNFKNNDITNINFDNRNFEMNFYALKIFFTEIISKPKKNINEKTIIKLHKKIINNLNKKIVAFGKIYFKKYLSNKRIDQNLAKLIGTLIFRSSSGQNVFEHCHEVAEMAQYLGYKLGLDKSKIKIVKQIAFFHDIGKSSIEYNNHDLEGYKIISQSNLDSEISDNMVLFDKKNKLKDSDKTISYLIARILDWLSASNSRSLNSEICWNNFETIISQHLKKIDWINTFDISSRSNILNIYLNYDFKDLYNRDFCQKEIIKILNNVKFYRNFPVKFYLSNKNKNNNSNIYHQFKYTR
ncbi:HD/HDIG domain-containing protein [[Mycoplasma] cavipharyngis]|uniref:HDIG domain-containing metalloprotein n=1 Tax=[Mycoplasma] cavipharyngis TaxID=92757 RepID=UPI003704650F